MEEQQLLLWGQEPLGRADQPHHRGRKPRVREERGWRGGGEDTPRAAAGSLLTGADGREAAPSLPSWGPLRGRRQEQEEGVQQGTWWPTRAPGAARGQRSPRPQAGAARHRCTRAEGGGRALPLVSGQLQSHRRRCPQTGSRPAFLPSPTPTPRRQHVVPTVCPGPSPSPRTARRPHPPSADPRTQVASVLPKLHVRPVTPPVPHGHRGEPRHRDSPTHPMGHLP